MGEGERLFSARWLRAGPLVSGGRWGRGWGAVTVGTRVGGGEAPWCVCGLFGVWCPPTPGAGDAAAESFVAPTPQKKVEALLKGLDRSVLYGETHGYQVRPRFCNFLQVRFVRAAGAIREVCSSVRSVCSTY